MTHAGFAGALLGGVSGGSDAWSQHDNTGMTLLVLAPGQRVEVAFVNRTPHLG